MTLPRVVEAEGKTLESLGTQETRDNCTQHGAVILRGFSPDAAQFSQFGKRVISKLRHTPAHRGTHRLHRSIQTVTPGTQAMGFHAEYSHLPGGVDVMLFWTEVPAGPTMLCDGARLWDALRAETRDWFRGNPLKFTSWHEPQAWIPATGTTDISEVQRKTAHIPDYRVFPGPAGGLMTEFTCSAMVQVEDRACFVANVFPGAYAALWVTDVDGKPIPDSVLADVHASATRVQVVVDVKPGDVVMVHNRRVMHARGPQGLQRRAWAMLGNF